MRNLLLIVPAVCCMLKQINSGDGKIMWVFDITFFSFIHTYKIQWLFAGKINGLYTFQPFKDKGLTAVCQEKTENVNERYIFWNKRIGCGNERIFQALKKRFRVSITFFLLL